MADGVERIVEAMANENANITEEEYRQHLVCNNLKGTKRYKRRKFGIEIVNIYK